jgi:riboflavin biosynthesis pyrimidine reductase
MAEVSSRSAYFYCSGKRLGKPAMQAVDTLYEREKVGRDTLPAELATFYDGGLSIPEGTEDGQPYVIANFVETLDGVISYNEPGQTGGGVISGGNEADQAVMGLLRAEADAVLFATSSLRTDANILHVPAASNAEFAGAYDELRTQLGKRGRMPMSVVLTNSGKIDLEDKTFHEPALPILIATSQQGYEHLSTLHIPKHVEVRVIEADEDDTKQQFVSPGKTLALLAQEYHVRVALYEGGPTLLASLLDKGLVNELFLTIAPQIAGRSKDKERLALMQGHAFSPQEAPWATLLSTKLSGSHLFLRYKLA